MLRVLLYTMRNEIVNLIIASNTFTQLAQKVCVDCLNFVKSPLDVFDVSSHGANT